MNYLDYLPDEIFIYEVSPFLDENDIKGLSYVMINHEEIWNHFTRKYYPMVFYKKYWVNQTWNEYFILLTTSQIVPVYYKGELEDYLIYDNLKEEIDYRYIIDPEYRVSKRKYVLFYANKLDFDINRIITVNDGVIDIMKTYGDNNLTVSGAVISNYGESKLNFFKEKVPKIYMMGLGESRSRSSEYKLTIYNNLFYLGSIPIYAYQNDGIIRLIVVRNVATNVLNVPRGKAISTFTLQELKDTYNILIGSVTTINNKFILIDMIILKLREISHYYNFS